MYIEIFSTVFFLFIFLYLGRKLSRRYTVEFGAKSIKINRDLTTQIIELDKIETVKKYRSKTVFYGNFDVYIRGKKNNIKVIEIMDTENFSFQKVKTYLVENNFQGKLVD